MKVFYKLILGCATILVFIFIASDLNVCAQGELVILDSALQSSDPKEVYEQMIDDSYPNVLMDKLESIFNVSRDQFQEKQVENPIPFQELRIQNDKENILFINSANSTNLFYSTNLGDQIQILLDQERTGLMQSTLFTEPKDDIKVARVEQMVKEWIQNLDLGMEYQLDIMFASRENISSFMDNFRKTDNYSYEKNSMDTPTIQINEDLPEFYRVNVSFLIDGILMNKMQFGDMEEGIVANAMTLEMVYIDDQLEIANLQGIIKPTNHQKKLKIKPKADIIERIKKKYEDILIPDNIFLDEITLVYVPFIQEKEKLTLRIMWEGTLRTCHTVDGQTFEQVIPVFYDAVSGHEASF